MWQKSLLKNLKVKMQRHARVGDNVRKLKKTLQKHNDFNIDKSIKMRRILKDI